MLSHTIRAILNSEQNLGVTLTLIDHIDAVMNSLERTISPEACVVHFMSVVCSVG